MYQEFEKRAIQLFEDLKKNNKLIIEYISDGFEELTEDIIKKSIIRTENNYKVKIPESYYHYFLSIDELKLKWNIDSDIDYSGGTFFIKDLTRMFHNSLDTYNKDQVSPEDARLLQKGYRFFAFHFDDRSAIKISNKEIESNIYFIPSAEEPIKLSLTYPEYMESTLKTRGFWGWQYLFSGLKFKDFNYDLEEDLQSSLECLKTAFPNEDFREYLERFERMK